MRISDWSSDVCSSDLALAILRLKDMAFDLQDQFDRLRIAHSFDPVSRGRRAIERRPAGNGVTQHHRMGDGAQPLSLLLRRLAFERERALMLLGERQFIPPSVLDMRSEEHTSELQSLMRISYAVFCLN